MPAYPRFALAVALCLCACALKNEEETLELIGMPDTLRMGLSSPVITATKKERDGQGRMQTFPDYKNFVLISDDSLIADIPASREVRGVAVGTTTVWAQDNAGPVTSKDYPVTVVP